jgi:hypothetical protein
MLDILLDTTGPSLDLDAAWDVAFRVDAQADMLLTLFIEKIIYQATCLI